MTRTPLRRSLPRLMVVFALIVPAEGLLQPAPAGEQVVDGRTFTLPDGFTIERVAGPPLVDRPIIADFDEQGRLYVADSSGSNDKVAEAARRQAAPDRPPGRHRRRRPVRPPHRLRRQDDVPRGDAVARRLALRRRAAEHLEAHRHRRRRRGRPPGGVVPGQDPHRLRQRPARPLPRPRRLDLLVQGGVRPADLRAARQAAVRHPGLAHLPLPARRHRASSR